MKYIVSHMTTEVRMMEVEATSVEDAEHRAFAEGIENRKPVFADTDTICEVLQ